MDLFMFSTYLSYKLLNCIKDCSKEWSEDSGKCSVRDGNLC